MKEPNSESCVTRSRHTTLVEPAFAKATARQASPTSAVRLRRAGRD